MTGKGQIVAKAIELLEGQPHGLRYSQLHKAIRAALSDANPNTIGGTIWNLVVKLPTEIVSAEVKIDSAGLITAFGQACAYRLFSHKSYIVVPVDSPEDDIPLHCFTPPDRRLQPAARGILFAPRLNR